jgi:nitrogen fixation protein
VPSRSLAKTPLLRSPKRKLRETTLSIRNTHSLGSRLGLQRQWFRTALLQTSLLQTSLLLRSPKRKLRETTLSISNTHSLGSRLGSPGDPFRSAEY